MARSIWRSLVSRRSVLISSGLAAGERLVSVGSPASAARRPALTPISMSMHIHACFSEGWASMAAALDEANRYGIDVVWWTEHDFRMTAQGYRDAVHFDGQTEGSGTRRWRWERTTVGHPAIARASFVDRPHSPEEAGNALRLVACGEGHDFAGLRLVGMAWNSTYTTCLADTMLEIDVHAETLDDDALLMIEIMCSYHPRTHGRPAGEYWLRYEFGGSSRTRRVTSDAGDPLLGVVTVPGEAGSDVGQGWRRLRLRPVDDIAACWPDLVAGDNALFRIRVGAQARRGRTARVVVDRLRFHRNRRESDEPLAMQAELMRHYTDRFPKVRQYQSAEISLVRHMNWFGGDLSLPRYDGYYPDGPPVKDGSKDAARTMVEHIHDADGLAQLNHPAGGLSGPELGAYLVGTKALGCDIVELGRRQLDVCMYALDVAARNAVFFTASGVNDDHSATDWDRRWPWVTSVWARSAARRHLVDALRAGRAWIGDPGKWRGRLDLSVHGQPAMGGVAVGPPEAVPLVVTATGLPDGGALDVVEGPVDFPGVDHPVRNIRTRTIPASELRRGRARVWVRRGSAQHGVYVRTVARDAHGDVVGLSNPVWLLPDDTRAKVPPARQLRW